MSGSLRAGAFVLAIGALLFASPSAPAQEHVRLMPQLGTAGLTSVATSPDGRFVLTGSWSSRAQLWDASTGQQIRSFDAQKFGVSSVAFSPNGRQLLIGGGDQTARLWDVYTGKMIRSFDGHKLGVSSVAFSADGRHVLTGSGDGILRLWDVTTGELIRSFEGQAGDATSMPPPPDDKDPRGEMDRYLVEMGRREVTSVAFSPDGGTVLAGSKDGLARLWDANSAKEIRSFQGHTDAVTSVAFSPNGRFVVTASGDKTARLWDVASTKEIRSFTGHTEAVNSVAFSPDGRSVVTGSDDKTVRLWDVAGGKEIRSFLGHSGKVTSVAFSRDGRFVFSCEEGQRAIEWESASGKQIRVFAGHTSAVTSLSFSHDGRSILTGSRDKTARLWDTVTGEQVRSFTGHAGAVTSVAFSLDSHLVLTGSEDKTARLWDASSAAQIRLFKGHEDGVSSVAFSPDGSTVLTGSSSFGGKDHAARLWSAATGEQLRAFEGYYNSIGSVAYSPDGRFVLEGLGSILGSTPSNDEARLWDTASGQRVPSFALRSTGINAVAFSPDGRFVATGNGALGNNWDKTAWLWDASTGQPVRSFDGEASTVDSVAFSPDGRLLLTGSWDNTARLWDAGTGQLIRSFDGNTNIVFSVAFSPDGRFALTGSNDTTTRLWDVATGKQLAVLLSFDNGGWAVADLEGRYDSNDPDNTPGLVWVTDSLRPIELKQLKDNYYMPNLLGSIMKGERLPEVKGLDLVPAPPEVSVVSPYNPQTKRLVLSIANAGGGVGRLVVSVNDRKAAAIERPPANPSAGKVEVTVDVAGATLKSGENTVKAYAFDAGNQIRSHEATATFTVSDPAGATGAKGFLNKAGDSLNSEYKPQFYAIVVGTASFPGNRKMDLLYPAHDAESIMTGLRIGSGKLFGAENIHMHLLATDAKDEAGQPTKKNIVAAFADVMKQAKPADVLLVYLSGHGVNLRTEKDSYYYLTTDARSREIENNPALRELSTVSSAELRGWLGAKNMPLKEVLILDTCAAGAANDELIKLVEKRDIPPDQRRAVEFLKEATGTIILMGSAADKSSYEASKYGQGLLTYALLKGMRGRSIEEGSRLNVSRWFENASEDVPQLAESIGGIQKPVIAAPSGTGFPVALLDPADQARIPLAAIKPEMVHLSCHDEDDNDPLGLAAVVRERLREVSRPAEAAVARGRQQEPPIVYHDDMTDGPADSLTPKIVYSVSGTMVSLRLRIEQAGKTVREERLNMDSADKAALASAVSAKLVELAGQVPLNSAKQ